MPNEKKEWAVGQLQEKAEELGRLPRKYDFDDVTVSRLKAVLGPWPRALETAGLKELKSSGPKQHRGHRKKKKRRPGTPGAKTE